LAERVAELQSRFAAGLEQADGADPASIPPEQAQLLAAVREAEPLLRQGVEHASAAAAALEQGDLASAPDRQGLAIVALADARERFLDVRGLIEAIYADEQQISQVATSEDPALDRNEFAPTLRAAQGRNLARAERLGDKLRGQAEELAAVAEAHEQGSLDPDTPAPDPQTVEEQRQHLELAGKVLDLARSDMQAVRKGLGESGSQIDWEWVRSDSASAVEHIETLRRLFLSITEHLRDVAKRQLDLADQTQDAQALTAAPDSDPAAAAAPLIRPQGVLAEQALAIANGLEKQSTEAAEAGAEDPQAAQTGERLREAGEHVLLAQGEMESAVGVLQADSDLASARQAQEVAVEELRAALEILEPPDQEQGDSEQQQQQSQQQQPQDQQQQQQEQAGAQGEEQREADPSQGADPGQLLQEVRDREAQRRRDRARRSSGYETVEKDW
jgi:hypothetical protein